MGDHQVVYSSGQDLDILPAGASKAGAARFLASHLGYDADHVICCGDSGNDEAMLTDGWLGVIVGNAMPELDHLRSGDRLYRAFGRFADGVVEGICKWTGLSPPA